MPAKAKTSDAAIIEAARRLLESKGREQLSLHDVAGAVGIRAPSLYRRFDNRAALLEAVELRLLQDLGQTLANAARPHASASETLKAQARAYRAFAKAYPNAYALLFDARSRRGAAGTRARAEAVAHSLGPLAELVGEDDALLAARVLAPFLHGFVSMELAAAFRLGGGLDEAFEFGLSTLLRGLTQSRKAPGRRRPPQR